MRLRSVLVSPGSEGDRGISLGGVAALLTALLLACAGTCVGQQNPDLACRGCHQQIYESYEQTPMAHASGDASSGLIPGEFLHRASGLQYRLFLRDEEAWLSYDRPGGKGVAELGGEQRLRYFIGSGHRGRTYLFERDGYWFESPVNWYSKKHLWDMNPKSLNATEMPFTLQVDASCLHCHTSGAAMSLPGARNHFAGAPFAHGGITCESCHGDATAHLSSGGRAAILNPAKLTGARRDSVCLQCHLEAEVAVDQPGRQLNDFHPGQNLFEDVAFFLHQGEMGAGARATSQWEALVQSACYRMSGGRMTCTTCHDPHSDPAPEQRVAFFRSKCLACHGEAGFVARHHPEQPDCTACHMARENTENVAHEQVTDHFIQKRPSAWRDAQTVATGDLQPVAGSRAAQRDLGLAYAELAIQGDEAAAQRAQDLLQRAQKSASQAPDAELEAKLGYVDLSLGDMGDAAREYEAALALDPGRSVVAADLALIDAKRHQLTEALRLWQKAFEENPAGTAAGYDLAVAECMQGHAAAASATLERVVSFAPDDQRAKSLIVEIAMQPQACRAGSSR